MGAGEKKFLLNSREYFNYLSNPNPEVPTKAAQSQIPELMNSELDRIKGDLETMRKALGVSPSVAKEWITWMERDRWMGLWWCLPGAILIGAALLPLDGARRYFGLVPEQWGGLLFAAVLCALAFFLTRKVAADDGRPADLVRESMRLNGMTAEGMWFSGALGLELVLYFMWGKEYGIGFWPFWAGLFLLMGSSCLVGALAAKAWPLLGWAVPFLGYALCLPLAHENRQLATMLLGIMFLGVALSFSVIAVVQIRILARHHDAD